jgi:hypothetical protein
MTAPRTLIGLALLVMAFSPASAADVDAADAARHIGQTVTVTGRAHLTRMLSGEVYIDLNGRGENAPITGYVSRWNRRNFHNLTALDDKLVEITGQIAVFREQPEIFLRDATQISLAPVPTPPPNRAVRPAWFRVETRSGG